MLPRTPGCHIPYSMRNRHDGYPRASDDLPGHGDACAFARRGLALGRHRPDRIPHRGGFVRDASDPAVARAALSGRAGRDGFRCQRHHHGHGARGSRRRLLQPAHRPPARHPHQSHAARNSHDLACISARSHHFHPAAHHPGPVHGFGLCVDAGLSRRAMQRDGCRRRIRGLYHWQCREQPDRAANLGGSRRYLRACLEFLFLRAAQSGRRGAGLFHHRAGQADACDGHGLVAARRYDRALAQPEAAAPPLASASASCSPSSVPSLTSISCWCARHCGSA